MTGITNYRDFDINQRINLKGLVSAWLRITEERFQGELNQKLYGSRTSKKGVQRSLLGNYRFGRKRGRTNQLRTNWRNNMPGSGGGVMGAHISFLLYGRFVDMGVGKGVDSALSQYQRNKRNGEEQSRKPVRWYSKRKGYETHRLRELLTRYYVDVPMDLLENALTTQVALTL